MISYHKGWYRLTVFLFLLAALLGTLLRFAFVVEVPGLHYKNALLSHTHLALLGWVHLTLLNFCLHYFSAEQSTNLRHRQLFVAILITTILLAVLLFVRGLDVWASPFFVIYVILNVVISVSLFRSFSNDIYRSFSGQLLSTGLLFFLLSFGGTVVLVSMVTLSAPKTMAYYLASQFFLHFQVNGWFTFGLFALFFKYLESHGISFNPQKQRQFIFLLALSTLLTFALSVAWSNPNMYIFAINSAAVIIQVLAVILILLMMKDKQGAIQSSFGKGIFRLVQFFFFCYVGKVVIQALVSIPYLAEIAYTIRNYIIGFLHLILIGFVSIGLITFHALQRGPFVQQKLFKIAISILLASFVTTELLLIVQGTMFWMAKGFLPYYYELLFVSSLLLPLSIFLYWLSLIRNPVYNIKN